MITLTASLIDIRGNFQFSITGDAISATIHDPVKAARILSKLGVEDPMHLVDHVQTWGAVEIVLP